MKNMPRILSGLFLAITLARVAQLVSDQMGAGVLGWMFAAGLGVAVYTASYWTRLAITRKQARIALVLFVAVDAYFNFVDVWIRADVSSPLLAVAAALYGLFPTVAVSALAYLDGAIQKLPPDTAMRRKNALIGLVYERIVRKLRLPIAGGAHDARNDAEVVAHDAEVVTQASALPAHDAQATKHTCAVCGASYASQQALAAHSRKHKRNDAQQSKSFIKGEV